MFKAPAVALNAKEFLHKLQTKKEHNLQKEFQVISNLMCFNFPKDGENLNIFKVFYKKNISIKIKRFLYAKVYFTCK